MTLRDVLLKGDSKKALSILKGMDRRAALNELTYVASHSTDPLSIVLVDSVREALDNFPKNDNTLLERCVSHLASVKKREWEEPLQTKYKGDPLKAYIDALRTRKDAGFLASEVLKRVGIRTLGEIWLHLALEECGAYGQTFVAASACRRSLLFADPSVVDPLTYWASEFLSERIPKQKTEIDDIAEYETIANDSALMKRVALRPGKACGNLVFLQRIKQNENALGRSYTMHLLRILEESLRKDTELHVNTDPKEGATMESLEAALKKKDFDNAISAINTLAADDLDVLCKTLLAFAATVREPKDAMPLIATHAACEISRTMGTDSALPMVQAVSYLFEKR